MRGNSRGNRMAAMVQENKARNEAKRKQKQQMEQQASTASAPHLLMGSTPIKRKSTASESKQPHPLSKRARMLMGDMDSSDDDFQSPQRAGQEMKRRMAADEETAGRRQQISIPSRPHTLTGFFRRNLTRARGQLGMRNLGNTCYMNAVAQVMSGLGPFVCDLRRLASISALGSGVAAALQQLVQQQTSAARLNDQQPISLAAVKAAMERNTDFTSHGIQQDAHEFFCLLLQQLQEEVLEKEWQQKTERLRAEAQDFESTVEAERVVKLTETCCPVSRNFEFSLVQRLSCTVCGHQSEMLQGFNHLSLELPDVAELPLDIAALLGQYMSHGEVSKCCEGCSGACTEHTVSHRVSRLPQVLVLHIKRFQVSQQKLGGLAELQKVHTRVRQSPSLSLSPWSQSHTMLPVGQTEDPHALHQVVACAVADKENLHRGAPAVTHAKHALSGTQLSGLLQGTKGVSSWPVSLPSSRKQSERTSLGRSQSFVTLEDFDLQRAIQESKRKNDQPAQEDMDLQKVSQSVELQALLASISEAAGAATIDLTAEDADVRLDLANRLREAQNSTSPSSKTPAKAAAQQPPIVVVDEEVQSTWQPDSGSRSMDGPAACSGQLLHRYLLRGCVSHVGHTPNAGHFVADVGTSRGWTRFDDSKVTALSNSSDILPPSEARERECYLLFYDLQRAPNVK